jgi:hypothetical protein
MYSNPHQRLANRLRPAIYEYLYDQEVARINAYTGQFDAIGNARIATEKGIVAKMVTRPLGRLMNWLDTLTVRREVDKNSVYEQTMVVGDIVTAGLLDTWKRHAQDHDVLQGVRTAEELHQRLCAFAHPKTMLPPYPKGHPNDLRGEYLGLCDGIDPNGMEAIFTAVRATLLPDNNLPEEIAQFVLEHATHDNVSDNP